MDIFSDRAHHARSKFLTRLKGEITRSKKKGWALGLLIIRLARLREINQEYGYEFADQVLMSLPEIARKHLRHNDFIARIGDREFGVIMSDTRGAGDCILLANQILESCNEPVHINGTNFRIRAHIGIANFPENAQDGLQLLQCADLAASRAENSHDHYVVLESNGEQDTTTIFSMEDEFEKALEKGAIDYYYQPKVDLITGEISGFEVLSRWNSEKWGNVRPDLFIAAAERSGLITELTIDSLTKTLKEFAELQAVYDDSAFTLSVNLSAKILNKTDSMERVINTVNIWCRDPRQLILEITEGAVMTDPEAAKETLNQLHDSGIKISIDDFGTGYSSLSYLKKLPLDELKIDKSFVMDLLESDDDVKIIQAIIDLAQIFNLSIVAEGVESKDVVTRLTGMGCGIAQGYYISKPLPFEQVLSWIDSWDSAYIL